MTFPIVYALLLFAVMLTCGLTGAVVVILLSLLEAVIVGAFVQLRDRRRLRRLLDSGLLSVNEARLLNASELHPHDRDAFAEAERHLERP